MMQGRRVGEEKGHLLSAGDDGICDSTGYLFGSFSDAPSRSLGLDFHICHCGSGFSFNRRRLAAARLVKLRVARVVRESRRVAAHKIVESNFKFSLLQAFIAVARISRVRMKAKWVPSYSSKPIFAASSTSSGLRCDFSHDEVDMAN